MATPPKRTNWFRFSLRTLLLVPMLAGSIFLLLPKRAAWRLDAVLETTTATGEGKRYKIGDVKMVERGGKHFTYCTNDVAVFEFDFHATRVDSEPKEPEFAYFVRRDWTIASQLSPDLSKLVVTDDHHAALYDLRARRKLFEWSLENDRTASKDYAGTPVVCFSNDGSRIGIIRQLFDEVVVLNAESGEIVSRFAGNFAWRCTFTPDAKRLILERNDGFQLVDLSGKNVFSERYSNSGYGNVSGFQFLNVDVAGKPTPAVAYSDGSSIDCVDLETGTTLKTVPLAPNYFEGFSTGSQTYIASGSDSARTVKTHTIVTTLSVENSFKCNVEYAFDAQGTDQDSRSMASAAGDLFAVSNPAGDVRLWKISTGRYIGELSPRAMTHRTPIHAGYDGPMTLSCMWSRNAHHAIVKSPDGTSSADAIYLEGQYSPPREGVGEIQRDFILRRNHPEEWWGLAWTPEFALVAAMVLTLGWSIWRDRRELAVGDKM